MSAFAFESDAISLPKGAWAKTHRMRLRHRGQTVLALTQGAFRPYIFPLTTPAGYCVLGEGVADHPHHSGVWVGSDHVHALMPTAHGAVEEYTYNFYVDEVFQGRAPGRISQSSVEGRAREDGRFEIVQALEWRGPREWGAADGRRVARETRTILVEPGERRHRIDVASTLVADELPLRLGPTRHAYFNARVADTMIVANGGAIVDDRGRAGGAAASGEGPRWVDLTGPVGGGATAGITVIPRWAVERPPFWFVADWGVMTVGPFRDTVLEMAPGEVFASACTVLAHDGPPDAAEASAIAAD